mmetsp:Transcript_55885/g.137279  ORF Transcript_55885/g.137279 Transcript_55885/m.137279 type:complete len:222 (-) Transcript_55885:1681-2346(-)
MANARPTSLRTNCAVYLATSERIPAQPASARRMSSTMLLATLASRSPDSPALPPLNADAASRTPSSTCVLNGRDGSADEPPPPSIASMSVPRPWPSRILGRYHKSTGSTSMSVLGGGSSSASRNAESANSESSSPIDDARRAASRTSIQLAKICAQRCTPVTAVRCLSDTFFGDSPSAASAVTRVHCAAASRGSSASSHSCCATVRCSCHSRITSGTAPNG